MPAIGLTVLSKSVALAPRNTPKMAATESCTTENWVGIARNDFYSLIDKIYNSENNQSNSDNNKNERKRRSSTESSDSHESHHSGKMTSTDERNSAHAPHSDAEQEASRALLDMRTSEEFRPIRDRHPRHESEIGSLNEDLPIDLSRHHNDVSYATVARLPSPVSCRQHAALPLLTAIDPTAIGLRRLMKPKDTQNVKSAVKAKLSSKISHDRSKQTKDNTIYHSRGESGKHSNHSKSSPKSAQPGHNKTGSSHSPKECWVRVNKNMVFNLVENLAISSLDVETLGSEESFRTASPIKQSDKTNKSITANDGRNNESESPLTERNNTNKQYTNNSDIKVVQQTVSDNEIDVEKIDLESHNENTYSTGTAHDERQSPVGRPFYEPPYSADKPISLIQSVRPTRSPGPDKTKVRKRAQVDARQLDENSSTPAASRKRKKSDRSDALSLPRGTSPQSVCSVRQMLQNDTAAIDRSKSTQLMPELHQRLDHLPNAVFSPYDASLRASVLLSLACNPLMIERLHGAGNHHEGRNPDDQQSDGPMGGMTRQSPPPPSHIKHNAMVPNRRAPTHTHSKDIMTAETAVKSGHYSQQKSVETGQHSPLDTHQSSENSDIKTARESPKLGWVAVSKEDVHTIVDSVMSTMIYNELENSSPTDTNDSHSPASNQRQDNLSSKQIPSPHSQTCDQSVISNYVTSAHDVITPTSDVSPTSLSPRSDCSASSDRSISGDLSPDLKVPSKNASRGFKWKSSLLKRAREEGEDDVIRESTTPSPQHGYDASPPLISAAASPSEGASTNSKRARRNKRKGPR